MPDTTAARVADAASDPKSARPVNPDRVGEELADDANIWHVYDRVAREDDERRTKAWDNGLNNLALFAGLFSAVTTAFIIEAQQDMEPDYGQLTFLVLNATASGETFVQEPFVVPSSARTVNCLWVASLVLSLSAALIAIMGKDWIGMYTARPVCNLRQWAEMRTYRLRCVEQWYMSGVIAAAPVLLHVSLLLFGAGLVVFISSDPLTHHLTLGLSLAAGVLYLVTTFSAVVFSASPFKSPATQLIRAALSSLFSSVLGIVYRPKHNLVRTLLGNINAMVLPRADNTTSLPGCPPENRPSRVRQRAAFLSAAAGTSIVHVRNIPTSVRTACRDLQWSYVQAQLHSIASAVNDLPIGDWLLASTWTDLPADRRPKLLAESLSWLSGASRAPDVFRAVVFALGDLDVGPQVGQHTSLALRTRLRAEIRRTWQQADFLTLSRYVLADRNTPGDVALHYSQFASRFDLSKDFTVCCEDGLPARVKLLPTFIPPYELETHFPGPVQMTQPRMMELLMPYIQQMGPYRTDSVIIAAHRYRAHIITGESFNFTNLEGHLYRTLDDQTREAYMTEVTVKYGGMAGAVELLTFLCCHGVIDDVTKPAAVELVMKLLPQEYPRREHRCLGYLFGSSELCWIAWSDKHWSEWSLFFLSSCLENSRRHPFQPSSARTLSDDREFDVSLARTSVMLLSPGHSEFGQLFPFEKLEVHKAIAFLFGYLCQPASPSVLDNDGRLGVIRLILEQAALLRIVGTPDYSDYDDQSAARATAILAEIIGDLGRHLREGAIGWGKLFQALAFTEVKGPNGEMRTWELGEWIRSRAPGILEKFPSSTTAMQGVHDALVGLAPLCETNPELRAQWDRIGYPGRPGDVFSDPFLDVGAFFDSAEAPRTRPGDIFDDPGWLDLDFEFLRGAEEREYSWPGDME